nr:retinoblastoma-related protein [Tanacetum cinerariifolium]
LHGHILLAEEKHVQIVKLAAARINGVVE